MNFIKDKNDTLDSLTARRKIGIIDMKIEWFKTSENQLPNDRQRVLFYRSTKLTKIGEMIFFDREPDRTHFLQEVEFWANEINKPTD